VLSSRDRTDHRGRPAATPTAPPFKEINASGGWDVLYRDPRDGRFWELTYPHGDVQGGGPPRLHLLSVEELRGKYSFDA
jgi:hypothetical protein